MGWQGHQSSAKMKSCCWDGINNPVQQCRLESSSTQGAGGAAGQRAPVARPAPRWAVAEQHGQQVSTGTALPLYSALWKLLPKSWDQFWCPQHKALTCGSESMDWAWSGARRGQRLLRGAHRQEVRGTSCAVLT